MTEFNSSKDLNEVVTDDIIIKLPTSIQELPPEAPPYTSNFTGMFEGVKYTEVLGISDWDISHVTNLTNTFKDSNIVDDISNWNVGNVTTFEGTFLSCTSYNGNISTWDTSSAVNMKYMFSGNTLFNRDLSSWDVRKIPVEPEGFATDAISWVLPKPQWGRYVGEKTVTIDSYKAVRVDRRKNDLELIISVVDTENNFISGYVKNDFNITQDSGVTFLINEVVEKSDHYVVNCTTSDDFKGLIYITVDKTVSDGKEIDFIKNIVRTLDSIRSKILYNTYDDFKNGVTTLTMKLFDTDGNVMDNYYTKSDFVFKDSLNNTAIEVMDVVETVSGQYDVKVKTNLNKKLNIQTFIEGVKLRDSYTLDTNVPTTLNISIGDYDLQEEESTFTIIANVLNVVDGPATGLKLEDFSLIEQPTNQNPGRLHIIDVTESPAGTYTLLIEGDGDYRGEVGVIAKGISNDSEANVQVDYTAIKAKELSYFGSTLLTGEFTNPQLSQFTLTAKLVDTAGGVFDKADIKDFTVNVIGDDGSAVVTNATLNEENIYVISGVYNKFKSITVTLSVRGKEIGNSVLMSHPLEILDVTNVEIVRDEIVIYPEKGRLLSITVTARDINGRYVPELTKENFSIIFNGEGNVLQVVDVEEVKTGDVTEYKVRVFAAKYLKGTVFVMVDGVNSSNSIEIDYMPILQTPIDKDKSSIISGEYLDDTNTTAKLVVSCIDATGKIVENLVDSSFRIHDYDSDNDIIITSYKRVGDTYELYFTDYGISDLNLEVYVNELRIAKRYVLEYPKPRKQPVKTVATFDRFVVNEKSREIGITVEPYDDQGNLISDLTTKELKALLVPEQDGVTLNISSIRKLTSPPEKVGMYDFVIKGNKAFTGKVGFYGELVTIVIPTAEITYDPINIVDLNRTVIVSGEYDTFNSSILRFRVKCRDWDNNPIRNLRRSDFSAVETTSGDLFVISSIESDSPGEYIITVAFDEVRKATFSINVIGVPTANAITLEHPILLKTTVSVTMSFREFVEAAGKRYIETLVVPRNHLKEIIEDLPKGIFVSYFPTESFERTFDITRFTTVYADDGTFMGYNVQLYRPSPYKGQLGVSVDGVKATTPITVDYDPIVVEEEVPPEEEVDRIVTIVTRNTIKAKEFKRLYTCPTTKTSAIVDISIFSDIEDEKRFTQKVNVYLSDNKGLTKGDNRYLIKKDITIADFEIDKIIVGSGQSLYVESLCTIDINVRVSGLEEENGIVATAGLLSNVTVTTAGINEAYRLDYPLAVYASCNINVVNNTNVNDEITIWIADNRAVDTINETHRLIDKIDRRTSTKKTMYTINNITLAPNERIYVYSKAVGLVVNITGMVINANFK